ncbi:MAG: phenylalanine--tRNA ligase subunit beta [candidate division Zixibacteria bacterium]|nr:phenylalanine--tRNA ligase subunit beta [candidate division Zixibacteria bacterium]
MNISYNWLKSIIPLEWSVEKLADKLTMSGTEVEAIEEFGAEFDNIVTAQVKSVEKHPNADKLKVCEVSDGDHDYHVVCGAPNVAENQKVILAKVGAKLPKGQHIKEATIRGVQSSGMICSYAELSLGEYTDVIVVLPDETTVGKPIQELFGEKDYVFELEITPNRPDCLSHRGIVREIQALGGGKLPVPAIAIEETGAPIDKEVVVEILNPDDCPRYAARLIKGVEIKPSPPWLVSKLHAVGIRSINNVVDITNYVMMEYGHPLHAFDFNLFENKKVVVRGADKNEKFVTLDGLERKLPEDSVLITDGGKAVALGGIMGGLNSEVTQDTRDILLESAYFNPVRIRRTAKAVKLSTESSQRFERGADLENITVPLDAAARLIRELAGGEIATGIADCYPNEYRRISIPLTVEETNRLLGTELSLSEIQSILESLDLLCTKTAENSLNAEIPSFRPDLNVPADLIEEVSRIYGFDNIPESEVLSGNMDVEIPANIRFAKSAREFFTVRGFDEVVNWVLYNPKKLQKLEYDYKPVQISNPLSEDTAILRPHLFGSLLDRVAYNLNRNVEDIKIFEVDTIFESAGKGKLPAQSLQLAGAWTGNAFKQGWGNPTRAVDFYDIRGLIEDFFIHIGYSNYRFSALDGDAFLDSEWSLAITSDDELIGKLGKGSSKTLDVFEIKQPTWLFFIDVPKLLGKREYIRFEEPPKFPPSDRDLALVVDDSLKVGELMGFVNSLDEKYLEDIRLFDIYSGKQVPENKKSIALSLRFRHPERTLTDDEIDNAINSILNRLKSKYKLDLRE